MGWWPFGKSDEEESADAQREINSKLASHLDGLKKVSVDLNISAMNIENQQAGRAYADKMIRIGREQAGGR